MTIAKTFYRYWLPVLFWMAVIFFGSQDADSYEHSSRLLEPLLLWLFPRLEPARIDAIHHLARKGAHLTEYAVLAVPLWRAIHYSRRQGQPAETEPERTVRNGWSWREAGLALLLVALYAASDEIHQIFVPGRGPSPHDVFIDTCGGAAALLGLWMFRRWRGRSEG